MEQKSFLFYLNWENQIDDLDDQELRRLITNLIKYHKGKDVDLQTKADRLAWHGILPGLETNKDKYDKKVQANRENGKLGGAPKGNQNASKDKTTQINPEQTKQPEKREQENDKSKMEIENRKQLYDNSEQSNDNNKNETDLNKTNVQVKAPNYNDSNPTNSITNSGVSMHEFYKQRGLYG